MPCLTKSTRLMCHSRGNSCIWKNIWRMLEILMQARTALRQRRRGLCPKALELSQFHSSTRCLFSSLPWADSRRRAPATTALPGQPCRRRGRPAAGKERADKGGRETSSPVWELVSLPSLSPVPQKSPSSQTSFHTYALPTTLSMFCQSHLAPPPS